MSNFCNREGDNFITSYSEHEPEGGAVITVQDANGRKLHPRDVDVEVTSWHGLVKVSVKRRAHRAIAA